MTSLPEVLFSGGTESVVEGSVLWLYCEVNSTSPTLRVTWKKNDSAVVQDHPHLHIRSFITEDSSTFILILDYLLLTDSGTYHCTAEDGGSSVNGSELSLSGIIIASYIRTYNNRNNNNNNNNTYKVLLQI